MATKKNPTNSDLLKQLEANKQEVHAALDAQIQKVHLALDIQNKKFSTSIKEIGKRVMDIQQDTQQLKDWQTGIKAVEKYKSSTPTGSGLNKELIKYLGIALGIIATLVTVVTRLPK